MKICMYVRWIFFFFSLFTAAVYGEKKFTRFENCIGTAIFDFLITNAVRLKFWNFRILLREICVSRTQEFMFSENCIGTAVFNLLINAYRRNWRLQISISAKEIYPFARYTTLELVPLLEEKKYLFQSFEKILRLKIELK